MFACELIGLSLSCLARVELDPLHVILAQFDIDVEKRLHNSEV